MSLVSWCPCDHGRLDNERPQMFRCLRCLRWLLLPEDPPEPPEEPACPRALEAARLPEVLELFAQLGGRLVARLALLGHELLDHGRDALGEARVPHAPVG